MKARAPLSLAIALLLPVTAAADQQILDDLIVDGSICVGQDCVNGETFNFDTLRLKENNLRIDFRDTSSSAGFPTTDWRLVINESANGGLGFFRIAQLTPEVINPFTILADSPAHAIYVSPVGVGLGTDDPDRALHVTAGDTPTLRLEQTVDLGWPLQEWEMGGNESTFFIRDETEGTTPFRILPDVSDDMLVVTPSGLRFPRISNDGPVTLEYADTNSLLPWRETYSTTDWQLSQQGSPTALTILPNGDATFAGTVTVGGLIDVSSSRKLKTDIAGIDPGEILSKVDSLQISRWRYLRDTNGAQHLGPMAEDFHAAFGLGSDNKHIAPTDMAAVAVASAKALSEQNRHQAAAISRLERENEALKRRLERLEARLNDR